MSKLWFSDIQKIIVYTKIGSGILTRQPVCSMFVNLTKDLIFLSNEDGVIELKPCEKPARVDAFRGLCEGVDGFYAMENVFGQIENLPEPKEKTHYITELNVMIAAREKGRTDVYALDCPSMNWNGDFYICRANQLT